MGRRVESPSALSAEVSARMKRVRQRDTKPEMLVRSAVHGLGLRYFVDRRPVGGIRSRADLVFPTHKVAVFIDGCFWHGCPQHATWPKSNAAFWRDKIGANKNRDRETDRKLKAEEWTVIRVWEHEDPEECAEKIAAAVRSSTSRANLKE